MDQILENCPGTVNIADDILVYGKDDHDHDEHMHNLMEVSGKHGIIYNFDKSDIKVPKVKFYGCIYDRKGTRPDPEKVQEIHTLPAPSNRNELQQFLGLVQYMSSFVPRLADHTDPLRELLRKDSDWQWTASHQMAFENLKKQVIAECTLTYFDTKKKKNNPSGFITQRPWCSFDAWMESR